MNDASLEARNSDHPTGVADRFRQDARHGLRILGQDDVLERLAANRSAISLLEAAKDPVE